MKGFLQAAAAAPLDNRLITSLTLSKERTQANLLRHGIILWMGQTQFRACYIVYDTGYLIFLLTLMNETDAAWDQIEPSSSADTYLITLHCQQTLHADVQRTSGFLLASRLDFIVCILAFCSYKMFANFYSSLAATSGISTINLFTQRKQQRSGENCGALNSGMNFTDHITR
jgi:hypothetical protein